VLIHLEPEDRVRPGEEIGPAAGLHGGRGGRAAGRPSGG
jgi:hypothetical protein